MQEQLPYFSELDAAQRASVQLVVQTAVVNFVDWLQDSEGDVKFTVEAFPGGAAGSGPEDLAAADGGDGPGGDGVLRDLASALARNDTQPRALTEAILRYGRRSDAAAAIYASAAESRGALGFAAGGPGRRRGGPR